MGFISCHITPLVINSLGGRHTHKHTHIYRRPHWNNFKKPGTCTLACIRLVPGLITWSSHLCRPTIDKPKSSHLLLLPWCTAIAGDHLSRKTNYNQWLVIDKQEIDYREWVSQGERKPPQKDNGIFPWYHEGSLFIMQWYSTNSNEQKFTLILQPCSIDSITNHDSGS